ncbi:MAG: TonB-dependent receptor [Acidovorax sp.]|nr:TonB-dependent receptor [Acidovorax sp.]
MRTMNKGFLTAPAAAGLATQAAAPSGVCQRHPRAITVACLMLLGAWGATPALAQSASSRAVAETAADTAAAAEKSSAASGVESTLHEIDVRGSAWSLEQTSIASPSSVLADEALEARRSATLGETLEQELGVQASHFGAGASRPVIRGMDGPRVQVLSSGSAVQDASSVSPDHAVMADPMLAEQIEVLRGPSALLYGGAVGGVVNVLDNKIPTAVPENGIQGSAQARYSSADKGTVGAFGLTGGKGPLVVHVEGMGRNAQDYRVGSGWDQGGRVPGSFSSGETGSLGLSWVGSEGYLGLAYTRQNARYGLPGHVHSDCHPHGDHLHCGGHGHNHGGHGHGDDEAPPTVDMRSNRWDLRGAWRNPVAGIAAVRLNASTTRYSHDEVDDGVVATTFRNRAHDLRLEVEHQPVGGLSGVFGLQNGQSRFSADGEEATVQPTDTHSWGLFWLERYQLGDWTLQGSVRHDRQRVRALQSDVERSLSGSSASLGAVWRFQPGWQASLSYTHASRLPTALELFADGPHLATNAWERGDSSLGRETSHAWDLGLRKTAGDTTWGLSLYHHQINGYIYGRTLDVHDGFQLLQYSQADARFTGLEAEMRHRFNSTWALRLWGDMVRAERNDGTRLPRIAPARVGVQLQARWQGWKGNVEWVQAARQSRVAPLETATPGYGVLNAGLSYQLRTPQGQPLELFIQGRNLNNRLAYVHTSFIKNAAPLMGRNITLGVKMDF